MTNADTGARWHRPRPAIAIAALVAFAVLMGLGTWQMERRDWKLALIDRIETRMAADPVPLGAAVADESALDYRRVRVTGRFLHDKEMHLANRVRGGIAGVHVVTPLVRENAPAVLVNRGWVPFDRTDPAMRAEGQVGGEVTITGVARVPGRVGAFTPDNDPAKGFWITADPQGMARAAGLEDVLPVIVEADAGPDSASGPGGWPKGGVTRVDLRNDHLQYALTWYALGVVLLVIFILYHRSRAPRP